MDEEHQAIYRRQLAAIIRGFATSQSDPKQRSIVGSVAGKVVADSKARSWMHFKQHIGSKGYDSVLAALDRGAADMKRRGQPLGVRAMEVVGAALVGRHNTDPALDQMIDKLDHYIEQCVTAYRAADFAKGNLAGPASR